MKSVQPYQDVYIAVVTPYGGVHDRACELYQQLVGINEIRRRHGLKSGEYGKDMVRAIYGHQHYNELHSFQDFYKPRLLR
mmetsp:Transcript_19341/g.29652  ORF Transcript_19341/g.29652 Transcript_19341/m.29652 type:complete len:80 (+) Transcript_19341:419-658(+)